MQQSPTGNNSASGSSRSSYPLALGLVLALGLLLGASLDGKLPGISKSFKPEGYQADLARFEEVIQYVEHRYVDQVTADSASELALRAFLKSLDPYSDYIEPKRLKETEEEAEGRYHGIGLEFLMIRDTVVVVGLVDPQGPASLGHLQAGDQILEVNGVAVSGAGMQDKALTKLLRDSDGQDSVTLLIKEIETGENRVQALNRNEVMVNSIECAYKITDQADYIRVKRFSGTSYRDFMESLEGLRDDPAEERDLVLDLRDNPGGYLEEAVKIASQFFREKGRLIVYTEGAHAQRKDYETPGKVFYKTGKVIVLTDAYSASGAEVVAGAIQDWDRGVLIGLPSYGKGLVQEQYPLKNGGAVRLTTARYYTPSGRSIQKPYNGSLADANLDVEEEVPVFKSKLRKRELPQGAGIEPDILMGRDSLALNFGSLEDPEIIARIAFDIFRANYRNAGADSADMAKMTTWPVAMEKWLSESEKVIWHPLPESEKSRYKELIQAEVWRFRAGEPARRIFRNSNDPVVIKALELLELDDPFDGLATEM